MLYVPYNKLFNQKNTCYPQTIQNYASYSHDCGIIHSCPSYNDPVKGVFKGGSSTPPPPPEIFRFFF